MSEVMCSQEHLQVALIMLVFWRVGLEITGGMARLLPVPMWSRKENDERVVQFKRRKLLFPSELSTEIDDRPKCSLCSQQGSTPALIYIACEICGDWFHGDAFGLDQEKIESLKC
ncbi:uncharacterized protein LOC110725226 [Chenopodium quinoa]|uniref:uncharacterized protein LOC110725226 n=1 Tax=Chenopodium quinoa TaxID=63459 RepID=UPI000B770989|nr:uncharacterized protein LOC110725226 [Chenopodium quinoa]